MAPIYVAAVITTVVTAAFCLPMFHIMAGPHRRLAWLMVLTFPLSSPLTPG